LLIKNWLFVWLPAAMQMIDDSFLNEVNKKKYKELIWERVILFI
jgi:hypothetical protein